MQAVILAGGKGARLKPYTTILPKPLMPVGEKAILEIVLLQLKERGCKDLVFATGYLGTLIEAYFGDGIRWGVKIRYSREKEPLGTAGPLSLIKKLAPHFLVLNGDILCDLNYSDLMRRHICSKVEITICSYLKKIKMDLGVLDFRNDKLNNYIEKPEYTFRVSMGIYAMNRSLVKKIPYAHYYDFPTLIRDQLHNINTKIGIYHFSGIWYDIGRIADYRIAQSEFCQNPERFLKAERKKRER